MIEHTCRVCHKHFNSVHKSDSPICYGCALHNITGGRPPEESDMNTAYLVSGEMSGADWIEFQEDLERVDHSRAQQAWERENEYYRDFYERHSDED
jgi:hypothetical protein